MTDDATQISNLLYRYAELFDAGRFDDVIALFDAACFVLEQGHELPPKDMQKIWEKLVILYDGVPKTRHIVTNPQIYINETQAQGRSCYLVLQATDKLAMQPIVSGTYLDHFFKTPDGIWKFKSRQYKTMDLIGDTSQHMRTEALAELNIT